MEFSVYENLLVFYFFITWVFYYLYIHYIFNNIFSRFITKERYENFSFKLDRKKFCLIEFLPSFLSNRILFKAIIILCRMDSTLWVFFLIKFLYYKILNNYYFLRFETIVFFYIPINKCVMI